MFLKFKCYCRTAVQNVRLEIFAMHFLLPKMIFTTCIIAVVCKTDLFD